MTIGGRLTLQTLALVSIVSVLAVAMAEPAWSADRAETDCYREIEGFDINPNFTIAACTKVLTRGSTKENVKNRAIAYNRRGFAYFSKGDFDHAIADLDQAIALKPDFPEGFYNRAGAYLMTGDWDHVIADLDQAIALKPDYPEAYLLRGLAYNFSRDYDRAIADYDKAIALRPDYADAKARRDKAVATRDAAKTKVAPASPKEPAAVAARLPPKAPLAAIVETRIALVIGNSNYTAVPRLLNPPRDAAAVAEALRAAGFSDVQLVTDATRQELVRALNDFQDRTEGVDWAVVYFAGHGLELDGMNYVIPTDALLKTDRDVQDEAVSLDRVIASVGSARKLRLVILDACRNNPFLKDLRMTVATRAIHRGLARIEPSGGTLVAYAAKGGEEAADGEGGANSPFAAALVKHLAQPGLEVGLFFRAIRDDVLTATNNKQEPFVYGSLPREELFFRPE